LKIAIVNRHPTDILGGSEIQCDRIANGLLRLSHDVAYIAPAGYAGKIYSCSYHVRVVEDSPAAISAGILAERPDIVYWRFNKFKFRQVARSVRHAGIPFVFAVSHINDLRRFGHTENPRRGAVAALRAIKQAAASYYNYDGFKHVSGVVLLNQDYLGLSPAPREVFIPNTMDTEVESFEWPRPYITWIANLKPGKRPELFLRLAEELAGVDLLMIGAIHDHSYDWIAQSGTPANFYFLGPKSVQQCNGILAQALLMTHTCVPEGFGNNFIQAWLMGAPTVSLEFDPGGLIARHDLGGACDGDWRRFVACVSCLIEDERRRRETGARAQEVAREMFCIDKSAAKLASFLEDVRASAMWIGRSDRRSSAPGR
jgi:glycosyltransferase involved in cell wall biosynthesis